jgi:uncharacterized protein YbjQ (UPF0145 family)
VGRDRGLRGAADGSELVISWGGEQYLTHDYRNIMATMQTTTTFELSGCRITKSLGVVRGITVRTRSLPLSILGGLRTLFGGRVGIFSELCEAAREESFQLMIAHARKLGANAIVGVRYDTGPMVGAAEVLCYGTAVMVEPN